MRRRFLFAARHVLIDSLLSNIPETEKVVLNNRWRGESISFPGKSKVLDTTYRAFGVSYLTLWLGLERAVPTYIPRLAKIIRQEAITDVVLLDLYHWYLWQLLRIKRAKPELNIYLLLETKKMPTHWLSKFLMGVFLNRVKKNQSQIKRCLVWTKESRRFSKEQFPEIACELIHAPVNDVFLRSKASPRSSLVATKLILNARYANYKRHEDVFKALKQLKEKDISVELTCIGRADAGKERVEKLVADYGLGDVVTFLDPVPQAELVKIYQQHDVLILPSYNEAVGMVVPEAMACGLPTITSDTVGANTYVEEGETGLTYETGNVEELTAAIERLTDKNRVADMGKKAALRIREHFTPEECAERFKAALDMRA